MEKKKSFVFFFSVFFFGDVIIRKTGTMLATGQGPGATPSGSESITDGNGVWDPGVTAGAELGGRGQGRNNKLGFKLKYLSGRGTSGALEMKRNQHRCWDGAEWSKAVVIPHGIKMTLIPQGLLPPSFPL